MTTVSKKLIEILADYRNKIIDAGMVGFSKRARAIRLEAAAIMIQEEQIDAPEDFSFLKKNYFAALQQKNQEQAEEWLLSAAAAYQLVIYGPVISAAAHEIIKQRVFLASNEISNPQQKDCHEQAAFHAENVVDYLLCAQEAEKIQNHFLLTSWKAIAQGAKKISSLWLQASKNVRTQRLFGLIAFWRIEIIRRAENRNKRLLLCIASYFSTLLSQQELKDSDMGVLAEAAAGDEKQRFDSVSTSVYENTRAASTDATQLAVGLSKNSSDQISFCLPEECIPDAACTEAWKKGKLVPRIEFTIFYSWIYQSWQHLQQAGISCELATKLLKPGVIVTLGNYLITALGEDGRMPQGIFLVDVAADRPLHPGAQLHVVENKLQAQLVPHSIFIPHWPQRGLIPRDPSRGDRFENVVFFGEPKNLAAELHSEEWRKSLAQKLGISFYLQGNQGWHDYRQVDAVIAIRSFSPARYLNKPGTKLYNAWHAGVPFIGGRDAAYAADGQPGIDYLVATSLEEVFAHLKNLKENSHLRTSLVQEGFLSAKKFTQEAVLEHWKKLVQETIPKNILAWQKKSNWGRRFFFLRQYLACLWCRYLMR